ncbi:MAG: alpha/beta hydrolase [Bacteroides sp.]|nr:alpha/beta hydrolase [Bacteroides sp.]
MKKIILSLLCAVSLPVIAQEKIEMLFDSPDARDRHIDMTDLTVDPGMTVYRPAHPNGVAVIMCPGGGYSHQAAQHEGHDMAQWMNAQGITYVVLKYRIPKGRYELPLQDAEQAVRLVRSHADEWGVDPSKIGIMGASAGGHLATTLATHYTDSLSRPDFQILFYPVVTMDEFYTHMGSRINLLGKNATPEQIAEYSNELHVNARTPRAFIMLSSDDRAVPAANSINYYMALVNNGVPASLHTYPVGGHGWGFRDSFPYKRQWTGELEKWIREEIL